MAAALAPLPFLYGAVHLPARIGYVVVAGVLLLVHVAMRLKARRRVAPRGLPTVLAVLALAWAAASLVPLPAGLLHLLAPATWRLAIGDPGSAGLAVPRWHSMAVDPGAAAEGLVIGASHLAIFVVASASFAGRRGARTLAATLAGIGAAIAVLAIVQSLAHAKRIYFVGLERELFYGTFVNGNHTASLLGICAMACLGLLLREADPGKRAAWGLVAVLSSLGVMQSLSRGGMLALALALGAFLAGAIVTQAHARTRSADEIGRFFRRHAILLMLVGLAVFYLSWLEPQRIGRELATLGSLDLPRDYRTRVWEDSLRAVSDWPLTGAGTGSFSEVFPAYRTFLTDVRTEMAESEYVQLTVENGAVGVGLLSAAVIALLLTFAARYAGDPMRFSGAHLGLGTGLLLLAAHSAVDFPLRLPAMGALGAAMAGAIAGAVGRTRSARLRRPERGARSHPLLLLRIRGMAWAALPLCCWALLPEAIASARRPATPGSLEEARQMVLAAPGEARNWMRLARLTEQAGDSLPAQAAWRKALRLDPSRPDVLRTVAAGLGRTGDVGGAAEALRSAVRLFEKEGGAHDPAALSSLRVDFAEQLAFAGEQDEAARQLKLSGPSDSPRALFVAAELLAARDEGDPRASEDAFSRAAAAASKAGDVPGSRLCREKALLVAVNAGRSLPADQARREIDRLALAGDPGQTLRQLSALAGRGGLDAARLWGAGIPTIGIDDFQQGPPRLQPPTGARAPLLSEVSGGRETLRASYPDATTVSEIYEAPLGIHSSEPDLAVRVVVRAEGALGDQLCVRSGSRRVFGQAGEPDHEGWRIFQITGVVPPGGQATVLDAWCLDTRGRPGPFYVREVSLVLSGEKP